MSALQVGGISSSSGGWTSPGLVQSLFGTTPSVRGAVRGDAGTRPGSAVDPSRPIGDVPRLEPTRRGGEPGRTGAYRGTAYQTNSDGDSVQLGSKMDDLSPEERAQVEKLRARDREVRVHEEAHKAAAGALYRGGPYYEYQTGPDGNRYAVGGSVKIDTSPGRTPEETIQKARQIRTAALAPAEPSSTDRSVAASAAQMEAQAKRELAQEQQGGARDDAEGGNSNGVEAEGVAAAFAPTSENGQGADLGGATRGAGGADGRSGSVGVARDGGVLSFVDAREARAIASFAQAGALGNARDTKGGMLDVVA